MRERKPAEFGADFTDVIAEVGEGVAYLTINRPEKLNAFRQKTLDELVASYEHVRDAGSYGVVVLTGAGERAFCAGGDVAWEADGAYSGGRADEIIFPLYQAMRDSLVPTIARVNGYAIGGGHHLAYFCDFTVASENAIFGQNGPRVGSPAQGWLVAYLVRVVGAKRAREIWMLCRKYSAAQALDFGLANSVVPLAELDEEVDRWCDDLLSLSPTVLKLVKQSFDNEYAGLRTELNVDLLPATNPRFFESGEQAEGANAFLEKRTPDFQQFRVKG
jgi:dihydroxynaphthoic acid synthetase